MDKQQIIMRAGEPAAYIFNVISGVVKLSRTSTDGRIQIIGFRGPGEFFATAETGSYASTAEAITCAEVCRFPRAQLARLMAEYPDLQTRLFQMSNQQIATSEDHMFLLGRKTARERVASFLLMYGNRPNHDQSQCSPYANFPVTRTDIADFLGLTVETVSRVLGSFVRENYITLGRSHSINLVDVKALGRIAQINSMSFGMRENTNRKGFSKSGSGRACRS